MINVVVFSHLNDSQTFLWRERLVVIETQTKSRSPSCQKQCSMTQTFHHLLSDNLVLVISEKSMAVLWEHERLFVRSASAIDCFQYQLIKIDDLVSFFFFPSAIAGNFNSKCQILTIYRCMKDEIIIFETPIPVDFFLNQFIDLKFCFLEVVGFFRLHSRVSRFVFCPLRHRYVTPSRQLECQGSSMRRGMLNQTHRPLPTYFLLLLVVSFCYLNSAMS